MLLGFVLLMIGVLASVLQVNRRLKIQTRPEYNPNLLVTTLYITVSFYGICGGLAVIVYHLVTTGPR